MGERRADHRSLRGQPISTRGRGSFSNEVNLEVEVTNRKGWIAGIRFLAMDGAMATISFASMMRGEWAFAAESVMK